MREIPVSSCEGQFLIKTVSEKKRIDGRNCYDYRDIKISFGIDRGCCLVQLGDTRVMCQVSCDITTPKQARPSEGLIFVNLELSQMAAPQFEVGRQSEYGVEITRILERCIKESRCVDTESLCIMSGIKVWSIRIDIHVLNYDGGLIDAASIAAMSGLAHFRRPDVTVSGEEVIVHLLEDRDPVPLSVHHMPICITFAFFEQGSLLLVDPKGKEEKIMSGKMVIGMNKHREICALQMAGSMVLLKDQVFRCSNIALAKVVEITELIQQAINNDAKARANGDKFGFATSCTMERVTYNEAAAENIVSHNVNSTTEDSTSDSDVTDDQQFKKKIVSKEHDTIVIGEGGHKSWLLQDQLQKQP